MSAVAVGRRGTTTWLGPLRDNLPLAAGLVIVAGLIVVAAAGRSWAPHDPLKRWPPMRDDTGEWHTHPMAPLELDQFVLGTDYDGRDILSRLLWAIRPTLQIAAAAVLVRLSVGVLLGTAAGGSKSRFGGAVRAVITAANAVPLLIVALLWLHIVGRDRGVEDFVIALGITGWSATATVISGRVRLIRTATFVEAARSLGAGDTHLLWNHVRRDLSPHIPMVATYDIAAVLLTLAELGFLGFFFGGSQYRSLPDPNSPAFMLKLVPGEPELSQMLSVGWDNMFQTPWLSIWVGLSFLIAVMGFTLVGEGLQRHLLRRI